MTCRSGGDPPQSTEDAVAIGRLEVEMDPGSTAERVSPVSCRVIEDNVLAPMNQETLGEQQRLGASSSSSSGLKRHRREEAGEQMSGGGERYHDDDGAVFFDDGAGQSQAPVRLPPQVQVVSPEMRRRHRAAGHCPYRPWCEECVRGAANAHPHHARCLNPVGDLPELHSDYAFFRYQKGNRENTVTTLVARDRKSGGLCAHVVPRKGVGGRIRCQTVRPGHKEVRIQPQGRDSHGR